MTSSPYRDSPQPIVAQWRDYGGLALTFAMLAIYSLFALTPPCHVSLHCVRGDGTCVLEESRVLTEPFRQSFALHDLGVRADTTEKGVEVRLVTNTTSLLLPNSDLDDARAAFAATAEAFLRSGSKGDQLDVAYGGGDVSLRESLPFIWPVPLILLVFVYLSPAIRVRADRGSRKLIFERRPFGSLLASQREFDLDRIAGATCTSGNAKLVMTDGSHASPGAWASGSAAGRLVERINAVLASVR